MDKKTILLFLLACLSIALGAQLEIPFAGNTYILSDTLSIFWGCYLGARTGLLLLTFYLLLGMVGLPVFAEASSGWEVMIGPSGGYLAGFLIAAGVSGWWYQRSAGLSKYLALPLGQIIIYTFGILGLLVTTSLDLTSALQIGAIDYFPGAGMKLFLAGILLWALGRRKGERS
jgi:biotin transport system substrate-specific component